MTLISACVFVWNSCHLVPVPSFDAIGASIDAHSSKETANMVACSLKFCGAPRKRSFVKPGGGCFCGRGESAKPEMNQAYVTFLFRASYAHYVYKFVVCFIIVVFFLFSAAKMTVLSQLNYWAIAIMILGSAALSPA